MIQALSLLIGLVAWLTLAWIIPKDVLDLIVYTAFGYCVLGEKLNPVIEQQLLRLFSENR